MEKVTVRAAREIKVSDSELINKKIKVKVGASEKRDAPTTIYIQMSFWVKPKEEFENLNSQELYKKIEKSIDYAYKDQIKNILEESEVFVRPKDNIIIKDIPENINYNSKRNYISIEFYLHTLNCDNNEQKYPLTKKGNNLLYKSAVEITNTFLKDGFFKDEKDFMIFKKSS